MQQTKCDHCHLTFSPDVMIQENEYHFCCKGCQGIYHLLNSKGLHSFYDKLGNKTLSPATDIKSDDLGRFDYDTFYAQYVKKTSDGFNQIDLIIEGIHCSACIWLNEKVLYDTDGIFEANINFSNNKAKITWDNNIIKLSQIIAKIRSIGYNAFAYTVGSRDSEASSAKRDYFTKMMVAVFATMNIMMLAVAKYSGFFMGIDEEVKNMIHFGEFILATPVLFYSGQIFFRGAYFGIKNKIVNMDMLVAIGSSLTYIYSLFVIFGKMGGESYFDSVSMIITFVLVGKYLEVLGKKSAVDTLDTIRNQIPTEATIIKNGIREIVKPHDLNQYDIIELKPGEKAVVDGIVTKGAANFDESSLTGESIPNYKNIGSKIISGTINLDSIVEFRCTKNFENSTLNSIVTLLEDSLAKKPMIEQKANEISKYFSLTILSIAIITFFAWYFGNFNYYNLELQRFEKAFIVAISVIVIACPCALALATPIATLIGIGTLAKNGLIFKEAKHIETMAQASTLVVDKTGTLTEGKLKVKSFEDLDKFDISILYSLVFNSNHPISQSIKKYLEDNFLDLQKYELDNFKSIEARGLSAIFKNQTILGGSLAFLNEQGISNNLSTNDTIFAFAISNKISCVIKLEDNIKKDAKDVIQSFKQNGLKVIMLTGDNEFVAKKVADTLSINDYHASLSPTQKANFIKELKQNGEIVISVGDGINDALMLASSDIAVSLGSGADISISVSDVIILGDSLTNLKNAFLISKKTYKFIKQNLAISLLYNAITIPLAVSGFVIPLVAALSMSLSSLIVVGNSMRIKKD